MILTLSIRNVDRLEGDLPTSLVLDSQDAVIGRSANCDWRLPDPSNRISGRHCEIHYRDGAYVLKDISTNGTYLWRAPDRMPGEHVIAHGEVFEIGHYEVAVALTEPMSERTALWPEGSAPLAGMGLPGMADAAPEPTPAPEPYPAAEEAALPDLPVEEAPSWPVIGNGASMNEHAPGDLPAAAPEPEQAADDFPPVSSDPPPLEADAVAQAAPEQSGTSASGSGFTPDAFWEMAASDPHPGWENPEQGEPEAGQAERSPWDQAPPEAVTPQSPSADTPPPDAPAREPTSWGMSLPGRQPTILGGTDVTPGETDAWGLTPSQPAPQTPASAEPPRSDRGSWGVSLRGREALETPEKVVPEKPAPESPAPEPAEPEPTASSDPDPFQPEAPLVEEPVADAASEPAAPEPQPETVVPPAEPPSDNMWDSIAVPDVPEPPPFEIKLRPPTLFQPQPAEPLEDVNPAAAVPAPDPATFEGQLREPTSLYIAQAAGEAGALPLFADRYRIEGKPVSGPVFEDLRAVDTWLGRTVLLRRVRGDVSPRNRAAAGSYFARWRQFARHRIAGMPPIQAVADDHVVLDVAETVPLDQLLQSDSVRSFRSWILDRALGEGLRALAEIHALGLVHGDVRAGNLLVSPLNGAVFLANPVPEGFVDAPYVAAADIDALGRTLEEAAWAIGTTPRAVIGWMTGPEANRPTAVELLETIGLGMQALKPMFAPADPAPSPAEPVRMPADWTPGPYDAKPLD